MKNPDTDRLHSDGWDDHLRQRFADFESEPPANALSRILAELPAPAAAPNRHRAWVPGAMGLLLLLISAWVVHRSWPFSTQVSANLPQTKRHIRSPKNKPAISSTTPSHSITGENGALPDGLDKETALSTTADKEVTPVNNPTLFRPTQRRQETAVGLVETTAKSRALLPADKVAQTTGNQPIFSFKSAGRSVASAVEKNPSANKLGSSTTALTAEEQPSIQQQIIPEPQQSSIASLSTHPMQPTHLALSLPNIRLSALPQSAPKKPDASRQRPSVFMGIMPLYTYQRIDPVRTDDIWIKNLTTQHALSTRRAGLRIHAGVEWPVTRRISLRAILIYNQLNQKVSFLTPADEPDSVRVEQIDEKTVRVNPYYHDKWVNRQTNWHYVGAGTDFVFHLGKFGGWRHYASLGATVGVYLTPDTYIMTQPRSGFVQGSYGIERPLTPSVWLRLAPTIQYSLTTISDADGMFFTRPYTYGLTIGLRK